MPSTNPVTNSTSSRTIFARRLRELRVPRGFRTARSLATALGIDENRYTRYERAEVEPDLGLLMKICEVLALTPNDLLLDVAVAGHQATFRPVATGQPDYRMAHDPRASLMTPAPVAAQAGFAEAGHVSAFGEAPHHGDAAPVVSTPSPVTSATLKRRAIAWQLARFVGNHGVDLGGGMPLGSVSSGEFGGVQRTSRVFAAIERDPFSFVTAIAGSDRVAALSEPEQKRVASLIDDLISAVDQAAQIAAPPSGRTLD